MRAQDILGSPPFILLGMAIAHLVPAPWGYGLSRRIARSMARRRTHLFRTVRANLAHVLGPTADSATLDRLAEEAIYHAGCTYFDMFHASVKDYREGRITLRVNQEQWERILATLRDGRGTVLVGPHMSNFDLAAQWIAAHGVEMQALSLADPNRGTQLINALRRHRLILTTPITVHSLRQAVARLKQGGVVVTGVDRPVSEQDEPILFFDAPARLPVGHIRLALQTNARVVVACCVQEPDGVYALRLSEPLEMERTGDRAQDVRHNARRVLAIIEEMIREAPGQWLMFVPVWREEDAQAPSADTVSSTSTEKGNELTAL